MTRIRWRVNVVSQMVMISILSCPTHRCTIQLPIVVVQVPLVSDRNTFVADPKIHNVLFFLSFSRATSVLCFGIHDTVHVVLLVQVVEYHRTTRLRLHVEVFRAAIRLRILPQFCVFQFGVCDHGKGCVASSCGLAEVDEHRNVAVPASSKVLIVPSISNVTCIRVERVVTSRRVVNDLKGLRKLKGRFQDSSSALVKHINKIIGGFV
mmetsp:Transcript_8016/g.22689  ORF Transcript_8016/g.22689 Transcript_8016/m.22689 type:complete len:208 (-) Transcript_8016:1031-1654(-)